MKRISQSLKNNWKCFFWSLEVKKDNRSIVLNCAPDILLESQGITTLEKKNILSES